MRKITGIVFTAVFFGLCLLPALGMFAGRSNTGSEKRELAVMPSYFSKNGINGEITKQFDDYFTDNFAFRQDLITIDALLYRQIFSQSISDQVIIGKDGWLFFEPTMDDFTKTNVLSDNQIYRLYRTLSIQQTYLAKRNISFIFAAAPNKESIYGKYMPDRYTAVGSLSNFEKLVIEFDAKKFDFVNLHDVLRDGGKEIGIDSTVPAGEDVYLYHKMDTHWNNIGALLAYNALLSKAADLDKSFEYDTHLDLKPVKEWTWPGDLSGMLYPTAGYQDAQYDYKIGKEYKTGRPIKSMEDLTIETSCPTGKSSLLMFRDSFANALIPMMSNEFSSVNYSRATPYDYTQINAETNLVILEIAERNLPNIIKQAPVMPAYQVVISGPVTPADLETKVKIEDQGANIRIAGLAVPPQFRTDVNYDIYIRLTFGDSSYTYVTFPILEEAYFPDVADKAGAAFSVLIDKNSLPEGQYSMEAICFDQTKYIVGGFPGTMVAVTR